eukprot:SAG31_NODE_147_length_22539_cov_37.073663_18_plen_167_part_00
MRQLRLRATVSLPPIYRPTQTCVAAPQHSIVSSMPEFDGYVSRFLPRPRERTSNTTAAQLRGRRRDEVEAMIAEKALADSRRATRLASRRAVREPLANEHQASVSKIQVRTKVPSDHFIRYQEKLADRARNPEAYAAYLCEQAKDKELFIKNRLRKQQMEQALGVA